ncbi:MAG: protein-glutamine gamma-glutamyltransferase [Paenibacillaceae bacterium]
MAMVPMNLHANQFEWRTRGRVVRSALALNQSGVQFEIFEKSRCNEHYWTRTANGGFLLKATVKPSVAIRDIYSSGPLYAFECATAIIIILYKAVLDTLDESIFDKLFASLYIRDWQYDADLRLKVTQGQTVNHGDVVYFSNPDVNPLTPQWQGENAVLLSNHLYYGHGVGVLTGAEIIAILNSSRKPGSVTSAYLTETIVQLDYMYLFTLTSQ